MSIKPETIKDLLDRGCTSDQLVKLLNEHNTVKELHTRICERGEQIKVQYDIDTNKIYDELRDLRKVCPHLEVTYYPDASGNNDSCEVCNACGKEAKRFPQLQFDLEVPF